ncbi:hypothetical protein JVT61DRAFT_1353 [Boletus reticuloceps]|uniref:Uncharacterized protein n=1 Tax=Boletus reticuloceps TaxID=495285 RepID=A0A8I2YC40_9AGAM|nr:hypothetical protein JVT61DRAFT_1921 [Boletus reticuloceps]KAG6369193.1 hypothetical protein JVT61DRAFT_1353 [Boletus reticuloceps]
MEPTSYETRSIRGDTDGDHNGQNLFLCLRSLFATQERPTRDSDLAALLAIDLSTRYKQLSSGKPGRSLLLNTRHDQLGDVEDLNEAIVLDQEALHLWPQGHPNRLSSLCNLSGHLSNRYMELGVIEDLNETIVLAREVFDFCPKRHRHRSSSLNLLENNLSRRYNQLGVMEDLDEAIILSREAVDLYSRGHCDRSMSSSNLAAHLSTRYKQLGVMKDLVGAIVLPERTP